MNKDVSRRRAMKNTRNKVRKNTAEMFRISKDEGLIPLDAAMKAKGIWEDKEKPVRQNQEGGSASTRGGAG
jgi:hypothetical protein